MINHNTNTLWWLFNIIKKGFHQPLSIKDTHFNKFDHFSGSASKQLELNWNIEMAKSKNPNLLKVLFKTFGLLSILCGGIYVFIEMILHILLPLFVGWIISYCTSDKDSVPKEELQRTLVGLAAFLLLSAFLHSLLQIYAFEMGLKIKVACHSLVYQKLLTITDFNISDVRLDLATNDVENINNFFFGNNHFWKTPLETFIILYILYCEIGILAGFGMFVILAAVPIQTVLLRLINDCDMHFELANDKRIGFIKQIITHIKAIKLNAYENFFGNTANKLRERELNIITQRSYLASVLYSLYILPRVATFVTVIMSVLYGEMLMTKHICMIVLYYQFLNLSITQSFPKAVDEYRRALHSIDRVQRCLLKTNDNINQISDLLRSRIHNTTSLEKGVVLDNVLATCNQGPLNKNIDLVINSNCIYAITGEPGCGKSSLLDIILGESRVIQGNIEIKGTISYVSQAPWLLNSTIRQNILFGEEFDENRYESIVQICALERDFKVLKFGDETLANEKGQWLTEEQKSKINLARSIYRKADIYLIDDPLCIATSEVGPKIFENCIHKFLKGKCVVLVTNEIKYLKLVDQIITMEDGCIKQIGKFNPLLFKKCSSAIRDDGINDSSISCTELTRRTSFDLQIMRQGILSSIQNYFVTLENDKLFGIVIALIFFTQLSMTGLDIFVFQWTTFQGNATSKLEIKSVDLKSILFNNDLLEIKSYLYMYTVLIIILGYFSFKRTATMFQMSLEISRNLHKKLCKVILSATLQFYTRSTSNKLMQSFSHHMKTVDLDLSADLIDWLTFLVEAAFIIVCIVTANQLLIVPSLVVILIFYGIRLIVKNLMAQITNIEYMHVNTLQEHLDSSLQGTQIIRAFNAKEHFITKFNRCQDNSSTITYLRNVLMNLFMFTINITSCLYVMVVTIIFLFISPSEISKNSVGLAITQVFLLHSICQKGMRKSIDVETRLPCVTNILRNCDLECESSVARQHDLHLTTEFYKRTKYGHISFRNVDLKSTEYMLTGLNFEIKSKEKIAILGTEKSLIMNALFRFIVPECGAIKIDGFDIKKIDLENFRRHISIISHDPVIFSGTVRYNLDPLNTRSDSELIKLLQQIISVADLDNDINMLLNLHNNIEYLNLRQKQIICMARSLLSQNKIVVVDESTGNVDKYFQAIIHRTIQKLCADCTIIIIAKQLSHIMNCDRIMILDGGRLVEYDRPYKIIEKCNKYFKILLDKYDEKQRAELISITMKNCKL